MRDTRNGITAKIPQKRQIPKQTGRNLLNWNYCQSATFPRTMGFINSLKAKQFGE
jgi:hypothetical protein